MGTGFRARAHIESWLGTPAELVSAADSLVHSVCPQDSCDVSKALITFADGTFVDAGSLIALRRHLNDRPDDVLSVRVEVTNVVGRLSGVMVASSKMPGLAVEITGLDESRVLGATSIVFKRMMIGYVDRFGGWRGYVWWLVGLSPLLLAAIALSPGQGMTIARLLVLLVALVGSVLVAVVGMVRLPLSRSLQVVREVPGKPLTRTKTWLTGFAARKSTRSIAAVLGSLLLGMLGNILAELLPWP